MKEVRLDVDHLKNIRMPGIAITDGSANPVLVRVFVTIRRCRWITFRLPIDGVSARQVRAFHALVLSKIMVALALLATTTTVLSRIVNSGLGEARVAPFGAISGLLCALLVLATIAEEKSRPIFYPRATSKGKIVIRMIEGSVAYGWVRSNSGGALEIVDVADR